MQRKNFKINESLYGRDNILQSIEAFKDVCSISYDNEELSFELEDDVDSELIFWEFMNYAISLCNELN